MSALAGSDELPAAYRRSLTAKNLVPLWPMMRAALPHGAPARRTQPVIWRYGDARPELIQAGQLTPIEKAERRVLAFANPGLGLENMQATPSIFIGLQLILPGESAPNHRHSPSAVRMVIEGSGGFAVVEGEKCPMQKGDLILTPSGLWHEHGHEGAGPVIWLDALDLPIVRALEASYAVEGEPQNVRDEPDSSQSRYRRSGLVPYKSLDARCNRYPLLRYPWKEVREALGALAGVTAEGELVQLAYVNPETGRECMPVLGFSAIMLRPGETIAAPRRSASAVLHVVEGEGEAEIDGVTLCFGDSDTLAVPTHAKLLLANRRTASPAYLFQIDDAPLQRKCGFYEIFN
ncbi:MAG TPA: cupin domain-containing protein [Pseudomonadota bacterium]|nr:cupin domain-containing protein [Pseudomonadota bacterium]